MSKKHPRVIGTTDEAIQRAEADLGFAFPPSFRAWLRQNNARQPDGVEIKPVFDERDPRSTFDSIVREYNVNWLGTLENFVDEEGSFSHLLPFSTISSGDYYCFDYRRQRPDGECPVVIWSHETGEYEDRAQNFTDFLAKAESGEYELD